MLTAALLIATSSAPPADSVGRALRYRVDIPAPIEAVWSAWTESARVKEWFAPRSNIELRPLGAYEILFFPEAEPGKQGAEDNLVLAVQAPEMLSFTWDAPPEFPEARKQRTSVVLRFQRLGPDRTRVWFEQTGWGRGGQWDESYQYFSSAWKYVLTMLHYRYAVGPVDWGKVPEKEVLAKHERGVTAW
jgi:uncharacterized protein YndB with AHSA1/START domain